MSAFGMGPVTHVYTGSEDQALRFDTVRSDDQAICSQSSRERDTHRQINDDEQYTLRAYMEVWKSEGSRHH